MTDFQLTEVNIVVLGQGIAPSFLQSSLLQTSGIVPADWKTVEQPMSTPFLSFVRFETGFTFLSDGSKIEISHASQGGLDVRQTTMLPEFFAKYLEAVPPFKCTAMGINVSGFYPVGAPAISVLSDGFLRNVSLRGLDPSDALVKLGYPNAGPYGEVINLTLTTGQALRNAGGSDPAIIVSINYHSELAGVPSRDLATEIRKRFATNLEGSTGILSFIDSVSAVQK